MSTLKGGAGLRDRLVHQPQTLWLRRALFQLHLWTGLAICLYVLVISVSGSVIVFRRELDLALCPPAATARPSPRDRHVVPCEPAAISRLAELHDDLLAGRTGRAVNGAGAALVLLMCLSGAVLWWPGKARCWRSMTLRRRVHWRRLLWDLHSALGFWSLALILMWAVSSVYFALPDTFNDAVDWLTDHGAGPDFSHRVDVFTDWLSRLHFGRAFGPWVEALWALLGLVPVGLAVTGVLMWWNRVLRKTMRRSGEAVTTSRAESPPA